MVTCASLFIPWWSIRAINVSIDVYPFKVTAWNVPTHDADWVVNRLLALDSTIPVVGLLLIVSIVLSIAGSLKFTLLLIAPLVLNLSAVFIFYGLIRSAIGKLAHGYFSGTSLIPVGPWGFAIGIGLCAIAGLASPIPLVLHYLRFRVEQKRTMVN